MGKFRKYSNSPVYYGATGVAAYKTIRGTSVAFPHTAGVLLFDPAIPEGSFLPVFLMEILIL